MGHIPAGHVTTFREALESWFSNGTPEGLRDQGSCGWSTTTVFPIAHPKEPSSANSSGGTVGKLLQESSASVSHVENGEREDNTTYFGGGVVAVGNEGTQMRKLLGGFNGLICAGILTARHVVSAQYTAGAGLFLSRT